MKRVREFFGDIDIYLFDQILKNQFSASMSILDAGCGDGRNLVYFLRNEFRVFGIDKNPKAIEYVRDLAKSLAPQLSINNFQVYEVEAMPFPDGHFDAVLSSAVLHFAGIKGKTARVISAKPQKFVSNIRRTSRSSLSSIAPK